jgi:hypothetical protein
MEADIEDNLQVEDKKKKNRNYRKRIKRKQNYLNQTKIRKIEKQEDLNKLFPDFINSNENENEEEKNILNNNEISLDKEFLLTKETLNLSDEEIKKILNYENINLDENFSFKEFYFEKIFENTNNKTTIYELSLILLILKTKKKISYSTLNIFIKIMKNVLLINKNFPNNIFNIIEDFNVKEVNKIAICKCGTHVFNTNYKKKNSLDNETKCPNCFKEGFVLENKTLVPKNFIYHFPFIKYFLKMFLFNYKFRFYVENNTNSKIKETKTFESSLKIIEDLKKKNELKNFFLILQLFIDGKSLARKGVNKNVLCSQLEVLLDKENFIFLLHLVNNNINCNNLLNFLIAKELNFNYKGISFYYNNEKCMIHSLIQTFKADMLQVHSSLGLKSFSICCAKCDAIPNQEKGFFLNFF